MHLRTTVFLYFDGLVPTSLRNVRAKGREDFRRYYDSAIEVVGVESAQIAAAARDNGVYLVVGVIERAAATLYCTVLMYAPDGTLLGKHRKLMPTALERLIWGMGMNPVVVLLPDFPIES